jgi:hypothetical protein
MSITKSRVIRACPVKFIFNNSGAYFTGEIRAKKIIKITPPTEVQ